MRFDRDGRKRFKQLLGMSLIPQITRHWWDVSSDFAPSAQPL
jgi:hypothetical protein